MTTTCTNCGRAFAKNELFASPEGLLCTDCGGAPPKGTLPVPPITIGAFVFGMFPFFAHYTTSSSSTVNGEVVAETFRDYVAIGSGGIGLLCATGGILMALRGPAEKRPMALGGAAIAEALCLFQIVHGFGIF